MAEVGGLKVSHADCPWWGHSVSCSSLWTMLLTHLTMSIMSEALAAVEVWVVQHQNFCAAGKGRSPLWQFTLELTSPAPRNGTAASCPLAILKGFCAWGYGGPWATSDPRRPWGQPVGCGELHDMKLLRGLEGGPETRCLTVQKQPLFDTPTSSQDSL